MLVSQKRFSGYKPLRKLDLYKIRDNFSRKNVDMVTKNFKKNKRNKLSINE